MVGRAKISIQAVWMEFPALNHDVILPNRAVTLKKRGGEIRKERGRLRERQISGKRE